MEATTIKPHIIPRAEHPISRASISSNALKVLYRLRSAGYRACLVGGGVRDLLLGREPKDFDIATDAHPEQVYRLFRNCRLVGRRFRLAHVQFGDEIIEVATFRSTYTPDDGEDGEGQAPTVDESGRILSDNVYGSIEDDAWRRDFTINALYYDIEDFSVIDYANGMADLQQGIIRLIGEPEQRYREDPVRMLRALRFAAKLGFRLDAEAEAPLRRLAGLLADIPPARLFDEVLKLFMAGQAESTFELLRRYRLFGQLFPATEHCLAYQQQHYPRTLLVRALRNTDERIADGKPVAPYFLYAALLWEPVHARWVHYVSLGTDEYSALEQAAEEVLAEQIRHTAIPKRISQPMREIWLLQPRFAQTAAKRALRLLTHPRFRAAYDFFCLRAELDPQLAELARWWTQLQNSEEGARPALFDKPLPSPASPVEAQPSAAPAPLAAEQRRKRKRKRPIKRSHKS